MQLNNENLTKTDKAAAGFPAMAPMKRSGLPGCGRGAYTVLAICAMTAIALPAQTFTKLVSFNGPDGRAPQSGLVQAANGDIYGTTLEGGRLGPDSPLGSGEIFKIAPNGTLTKLYSFCRLSQCADGSGPSAALAQGADGDFYGTTSGGGAHGIGSGGWGTVFKITPGGELTTLYNFCSRIGCVDGGAPYAGLVRDADGDFYGTTPVGGVFSKGTVFKITSSGKLATVYSFCSQMGCADGESPDGTLVQATNGSFYGTTASGGANLDVATKTGGGTVFEITPSGTLTTLYSFCAQSECADGASPNGGLIQAADGNFYGTTSSGGTNSPNGGYGTVFQIAPSGRLTTLYSFCAQSGCTDGYGPAAGVIQATDGNFYGTTVWGGAGYGGTIFTITPSGTLTTLHSFVGTDGNGPNEGLIQATNGTFYGTTASGGQGDRGFGPGTVFSLSVGLSPFVETQPAYGKVGAQVRILGTDLTGAAGVTFDGAAAGFEVVSSSEIVTTVPGGATSGTVEVVAACGTLSSKVPFQVH